MPVIQILIVPFEFLSDVSDASVMSTQNRRQFLDIGDIFLVLVPDAYLKR